MADHEQRSRIYHPDARVTLGVFLESIRSDSDNRPFAFPVRPTSLTIFRNSYVEADTFSVTFSATDLPLTPDIIRGASAEIYLFNKRSIGEQPETIAKGADSDLFYAGADVKPAIVGLVDEASMDMDDAGRFVTVTGRDYTALFLDQPWDVRTLVTQKDRLDKVLQNIVDTVPSASGVIQVRVEMGPELSAGTAAGAFQSYKDFVSSQSGTHSEAWLNANIPTVGKSEGRANRRGMAFPNKANFWEVMLSLAIRHGFIIFVKGTDIILTTPRAYIEGKTGVHTMAWGRNLSDIHMSRKLGREKVPTIECISWDESKQTVVTGRFPSADANRQAIRDEKAADKQKSKIRNPKPPPKTKRTAASSVNGLGTAKDEIQQYTMPGITSEAQLTAIAKQVWTQKGRAEMSVQIATSDLEDLDGDTIFDISSGDAMAVKFEPFNADITAEQLEAEMLNRGYEPDVAYKLARATEEMNELREPMRVNEATIDFSVEDGITISATLQNFVNLSVHGGAE